MPYLVRFFGLPIIITILLMTFTSLASADSLSVSPAGSNHARGETSDPFATISHAANVAKSGDTIFVAPGVYKETISFNNKRNLTFQGTGKRKPIISGEGKRAYGFKNLYGNDISIQGFELTGQTEAGIYSLGKNNLINNNHLHHIGSSSETHSNGIRIVWGESSRVINNTIHHIGPGSESMGIWLLETRDNQIENNTVYLVRKEGIRDWKGLSNEIISNRVFLNWAGISLNTATAATVKNNYIYHNVEGLTAKHLSYKKVLSHWKLPQGLMSTVAHNTLYRHSEAGLWVAQSDEPLDYLQVNNNLFAGGGYAYLRDRVSLRGTHVKINSNAYSTRYKQPRFIYKEGWSSAAGLDNWSKVQTQIGWERRRRLVNRPFKNPARGNLHTTSRFGAAKLPTARQIWRPYNMTAVDSSSKGSYYTDKHLQKSSDGDQASYWLTNTNSNEHVTYDFGKRRSFNHLILNVFSHFDKRNPRSYRFQVSDNQQNWRTILKGKNYDSAGAAHFYQLPKLVKARFLRFTMIDNFCDSYAPKTDCGDIFVLSDLQAGRLWPPVK